MRPLHGIGGGAGGRVATHRCTGRKVALARAAMGGIGRVAGAWVLWGWVSGAARLSRHAALTLERTLTFLPAGVAVAAVEGVGEDELTVAEPPALVVLLRTEHSVGGHSWWIRGTCAGRRHIAPTHTTTHVPRAAWSRGRSCRPLARPSRRCESSWGTAGRRAWPANCRSRGKCRVSRRNV